MQVIKPENTRKCHALFLTTIRYDTIRGKAASRKLVGVKWCNIHKECHLKV